MEMSGYVYYVSFCMGRSNGKADIQLKCIRSKAVIISMYNNLCIV